MPFNRLKLTSLLLKASLIGAGLALMIQGVTSAQPSTVQTKPPGNGPSRWQHESPVVFVAYTPDGKHVLTATYEGTIRKWNAASGKEELEIEKGIKFNHSDVRCRVAALSPNGKLLAVATYASVVNLYDVATGRLLRQIKTADDQMSGASSLVFAPNSRSVFTGRFLGRAVSNWDVASGKELRRLGDKVEGPFLFTFGTLSVSRDGKVVASVVSDPKGDERVGPYVRRWNVTTGKELSPAKGGAGVVVFSNDGKTVARVDVKNGLIRLWDLEADKELRSLEGTGTVSVFSRDGKLLAGRDAQRVLCVWDVQTGKVLRKFGEPASRPLNRRADVIAFSADAKRLVTGVGIEVRQWDVASGKELGLAVNQK